MKKMQRARAVLASGYTLAGEFILAWIGATLLPSETAEEAPYMTWTALGTLCVSSILLLWSAVALFVSAMQKPVSKTAEGAVKAGLCITVVGLIFSGGCASPAGKLAATRSGIQRGSDSQRLQSLQEWAKYCVERGDTRELFAVAPNITPIRHEMVEYIAIPGVRRQFYLWRSAKNANATDISPKVWYEVAFPYPRSD